MFWDWLSSLPEKKLVWFWFWFNETQLKTSLWPITIIGKFVTWRDYFFLTKYGIQEPRNQFCWKVITLRSACNMTKDLERHDIWVMSCLILTERALARVIALSPRRAPILPHCFSTASRTILGVTRHWLAFRERDRNIILWRKSARLMGHKEWA